jgi:diacylglycerol kinase
MMSDPTSKRPPLSWAGKFRVAFRGIYFGVAGQASFAVHFLVAVLVIVLSIVLKLDGVSWCILLLCMALVLTTELLNSAIEILFRGLPVEVRDRSWPALDVAAGAVLVASLLAAVIGLIVLVPPLFRYFG